MEITIRRNSNSFGTTKSDRNKKNTCATPSLRCCVCCLLISASLALFPLRQFPPIIHSFSANDQTMADTVDTYWSVNAAENAQGRMKAAAFASEGTASCSVLLLTHTLLRSFLFLRRSNMVWYHNPNGNSSKSASRTVTAGDDLGSQEEEFWAQYDEKEKQNIILAVPTQVQQDYFASQCDFWDQYEPGSLKPSL